MAGEQEKCTNEHVMILFIDAYYFLLFVLFLPSVYSADIAPVLHPFETDTLYVIVGLGSCFLVGLAKGGDAQHPSSGGDRRHVWLSRAARLARSGASQLCGILFGCSGTVSYTHLFPVEAAPTEFQGRRTCY